MFAFIVAIAPKAAPTCAGNDTINTMVTRRSTHAHHAKPRSSAARRAKRNAGGGSSYAGGTRPASRGGRVGNVAGLGNDAAKNARPGRSSRGGATSVGNVAGLGGPGASPNKRSRQSNSNRPPAARNTNGASGIQIPTPNGGEVLLTRRHFLYGALGIGALAAAAGGASVVVDQMNHSDDDTITVLEVPETAVVTSDSLTEVNTADHMSLIGNFELPYGTLVWANDDTLAACLLPTEQANPVAQVGLLSLGSGSYTIVLEKAVGADEGFEIYDVRATSAGLVWTEADILDGTWRVYAATHDGASTGEPTLVEEGGIDWDTPTITAVGNYAFWQVVPKVDGERYTEGSSLKRVKMGSSNVEIVYEARGRMATPPYALADSVVITPRADSSTVYYQLTHIDAESNSVLDTMTLPASMRPLEAGYGETGFMFSFDAIYNYGDGISNLGTYTPTSAVTDGSYSDATWFRFSRTPTAAPAWCGSYLMVKSTKAVCGINLATNESFSFDVENGADDYGEYLASTGTRDAIVTFTNVDDNPVNGEPKKACIVKVWAPTT